MPPYDLDDKLVVAIASSALFDLSESDKVFRTKGLKEYREYQAETKNKPLGPGVAFPFVQRLLSLNDGEEARQVEVVLLSRNDAITGERVRMSIRHHGLDITRMAFLRGDPPYPYIPAFRARIFLSANEENVMEAIESGFPAGLVLKTEFIDDADDRELRVAFDFDGVLADHEAELIYKTRGLEAFFEAERSRAGEAHQAGPLLPLLQSIARIQERENQRAESTPGYMPRVKIAVVTARNDPAIERMTTSLKEWGIVVDNTFCLGGMEKTDILRTFRPHIFFDDQRIHLDPAADTVPCVHIPMKKQSEESE